jgi:hypothetical protein
MIDLFQVLFLVPLVMALFGDTSFWLWCLFGSFVGQLVWPTEEDREIRRQVRKLERISRNRQRALDEIRLREERPGRGPGDWL